MKRSTLSIYLEDYVPIFHRNKGDSLEDRLAALKMDLTGIDVASFVVAKKPAILEMELRTTGWVKMGDIYVQGNLNFPRIATLRDIDYGRTRMEVFYTEGEEPDLSLFRACETKLAEPLVVTSWILRELPSYPNTGDIEDWRWDQSEMFESFIDGDEAKRDTGYPVAYHRSSGLEQFEYYHTWLAAPPTENEIWLVDIHFPYNYGRKKKKDTEPVKKMIQFRRVYLNPDPIKHEVPQELMDIFVVEKPEPEPVEAPVTVDQEETHESPAEVSAFVTEDEEKKTSHVNRRKRFWPNVLNWPK